MKRFPKLRYPSHEDTDGLLDGEVVVTEKIDGANFRFTWDDDVLHVGTRNHTYEWDDVNLPKAFGHAVQYLRETLPNPDEPTDVPNYTLFGEAMHLHSLDYEDIDWHNPNKGSAHVPLDSDVPNVVIFDVWDGEAEEWLDWDGVVTVCDYLGLEHSRVIARGSPEFMEDNDCFEVPEESMFGGPPEGIVVRRVDGSVRAKKVTEDFKETNAAAFNDPSKAQSEAGTFVAQYVTDARVEKNAHKLVDEGEYESLKMEMMEQLPRRVLEDTMAEAGWDILTNGVELTQDAKAEVRSKASKKCARVLKSELNSL